jgi:hypothetical protein
MAGIRLGIVDQSCLLDVAGTDGNSLRIAAHCAAEYVNGLRHLSIIASNRSSTGSKGA